MEIFRRFSTTAPEPRDFREDKPTLLWCTVFAITVILFRVCGRYVRTERLFLEDGIMLLAILPLLIRMGLAHVVLLFGTNNIISTTLSIQNIHQREIGSQVVLAARVMYAAYLWTIKYSTSIFLQNLISSVRRTSLTQYHILLILHIFLFLAFLATVISDLAACTPFSHYWQVTPDPGPQCRQGYTFLFAKGILDIVTNLALVILPLPMILRSKLLGKQKFSITIRLALPLLSVAFTIFQTHQILTLNPSQQRRTLLASLDILLSTFIANTVVLASLLQDRGIKKTKFKIPNRGSKNIYDDRKDSVQGEPSGMGTMWRDDEHEDEHGDEVVMLGNDGIDIEMENLRGKGKGVERPEMARMKGREIRIAQSWEVCVDDKD
ncbi:hypothetical protein G7Y89_g10984 [Cudoniella acicularis]|uniref:Rhodopsin domain-containing protein n=1 Tax=Cudoniella acicularis TaxID=354080 RepID=A0A8H4RCT1_9HELO|nr:hypothetical protein G7Y89_g10984 [Cudoniella acicularis]